MNMMFNQWRDLIHEWAVGKGWWSRPQDTIAGKLLLVHSEVSEAVEELRKARPCPKGDPDIDFDDVRFVDFVCDNKECGAAFIRDLDEVTTCRLCGVGKSKPEGFASELADTVIRVLDLAGRLNIDFDFVMTIKMEYNRTREQRHGGKGL